jgi:hypothetical protein
MTVRGEDGRVHLVTDMVPADRRSETGEKPLPPLVPAIIRSNPD